MLQLFSQGQMMFVLHCNYWYGEAALEPDKKDTETWVEIVHILGELHNGIRLTRTKRAVDILSQDLSKYSLNVDFPTNFLVIYSITKAS